MDTARLTSCLVMASSRWVTACAAGWPQSSLLHNASPCSLFVLTYMASSTLGEQPWVMVFFVYWMKMAGLQPLETTNLRTEWSWDAWGRSGEGKRKRTVGLPTVEILSWLHIHINQMPPFFSSLGPESRLHWLFCHDWCFSTSSCESQPRESLFLFPLEFSFFVPTIKKNCTSNF